MPPPRRSAPAAVRARAPAPPLAPLPARGPSAPAAPAGPPRSRPRPKIDGRTAARANRPFARSRLPPVARGQRVDRPLQRRRPVAGHPSGRDDRQVEARRPEALDPLPTALRRAVDGHTIDQLVRDRSGSGGEVATSIRGLG